MINIVIPSTHKSRRDTQIFTQYSSDHILIGVTIVELNAGHNINTLKYTSS